MARRPGVRVVGLQEAREAVEVSLRQALSEANVIGQPAMQSSLEYVRRMMEQRGAEVLDIRFDQDKGAIIANIRAKTRVPSPEEVEAARESPGVWSEETLKCWGVPWPPPRGWRKELRRQWEAEAARPLTYGGAPVAVDHHVPPGEAYAWTAPADGAMNVTVVGRGLR